MADVLFDAEQRELIPLKQKSENATSEQTIGGVVYAMENMALTKQVCKIVRDICARRNIPLHAVPVLPRRGKHIERVRFFDVRAGEPCAGEYCRLLLSDKFRIASDAEVKASQARTEQARAVAIRDAHRALSASALAQDGVLSAVTSAQQIRTSPAPVPAK